MRFTKIFAVWIAAVFVFTGLYAGDKASLKIDYEKYKLKNGLEVILHADKSDPIVAVAVFYHVGSNREEKGRTGFAHLFEHIMFQESQHVGQDQFFKKVQAAGGTLNGTTSFDRTVYFEIVPKNALEMSLWLEADRMGYLLPTVTQEAFINQQDVVQNEKRQGVDNAPYGHTSYVINKLIYPEGHSYNWQVIGSLEDLANATVEDVTKFFEKWYGPNNATLVIAGDYEPAQAKKWVEKYFGELKSPPAVADPKPMLVTLDKTKRAFHEDNFARSPELSMVFPTVQRFNKEAYALALLADLFADGKRAPLYKVVVEEKSSRRRCRRFKAAWKWPELFSFACAFPTKI
jgi:zinc protease